MKNLVLFALLLTSFMAYSQDGNSCETAIEVEPGTHQAAHAPIWYKFTMPDTNKVVVISSVGLTEEDTYLSVYSDCDGSLIASNDDFYNVQSQVQLTDLSAGDEILIFWGDTFSTNPFSWSLSLEDPVVGAYCSLAADPILGTNTLPKTDSLQMYWYSLVMPDSLVKLVVETTTEVDVYALKGDCSSSSFSTLNYGNGEMYVTNVSPGDTIFIVWDISEINKSFDWTLQYEKLDFGEGCTLSVEAALGTNSVPSVPTGTYWYEYTIPNDESRILVISSEKDANITIARGSCDNPDYPTGGYQQLEWNSYEPGEQILIMWEFYDGEGFDWELSFREPQPGETCESAIEITSGTFTNSGPSINGEYWYRFEVPSSDSYIRITSEGEFYANLYSGSCGELEWVDTGYDMLLLDRTKGEELYILWYETDFDWQFEISEIPELTIAAEEVEIYYSESKSFEISNKGPGELEYSIPEDQSIRFSSSYSMVELSDQYGVSEWDELSVSVWLYLDGDNFCDQSSDYWKVILQNGFAFTGSGYDMILETDRSITWSVATENGPTRYHSLSSMLKPDEWMHVVATYSTKKSEATLYLNGEKVNGEYWQQGSGAINEGYGSITLSNASDDYCQTYYGAFPGSMDELSVWNTILSEEQIQSKLVYLSGEENGLTGYWNFNSTNNNSVYDLTDPSKTTNVWSADLDANSPFDLFVVSPTAGSMAAGASEEISLSLNADEQLPVGNKYHLNVLSNDPYHPVVSVPVNVVSIPLGLDQGSGSLIGAIYPNPFSEHSVISVHLSSASEVSLSILSMDGRNIYTETFHAYEAGTHQLGWSGINQQNDQVPNGIYLVVVEAANNREVKRIRLQR